MSKDISRTVRSRRMKKLYLNVCACGECGIQKKMRVGLLAVANSLLFTLYFYEINKKQSFYCKSSLCRLVVDKLLYCVN